MESFLENDGTTKKILKIYYKEFAQLSRIFDETITMIRNIKCKICLKSLSWHQLRSKRKC